jgi:hypothetical protein
MASQKKLLTLKELQSKDKVKSGKNSKLSTTDGETVIFFPSL